MKKTKQLIKELQMLVANPEMDPIIEEKMMDMWRDARHDATKEYIAYKEDFNRRITPIMLKSVLSKMATTLTEPKCLNYWLDLENELPPSMH